MQAVHCLPYCAAVLLQCATAHGSPCIHPNVRAQPVYIFRSAARVHARRCGLFLHSPFPSSEIFRTFPKREELLRSMLNADLIGVDACFHRQLHTHRSIATHTHTDPESHRHLHHFDGYSSATQQHTQPVTLHNPFPPLYTGFHTFDYARHFLSCASRMLGLEHETLRGAISIEYYGRSVGIKIMPTGACAALQRLLPVWHCVLCTRGMYVSDGGEASATTGGVDFMAGVNAAVLYESGSDATRQSRKMCSHVMFIFTQPRTNACTHAHTGVNPRRLLEGFSWPEFKWRRGELVRMKCSILLHHSLSLSLTSASNYAYCTAECHCACKDESVMHPLLPSTTSRRKLFKLPSSQPQHVHSFIHSDRLNNTLSHCRMYVGIPV
jgi:Glycosyltransferase family 20